MKKIYFLSLLGLLLSVNLSAQQVAFEEYDLSNGLHVILHQDNSAPVVTTSVMYHVGAKDEVEGRTGFAHFFEHLLFEGTENIPKGEFFKIVSANGGSNNANTTQDRTYYYETFPSNNLALGLWLESERMLHPVINQDGVDTQNEVVKEEKRARIDNAPYGKIIYRTGINQHIFNKHPYKNSVIGSMEDLDAAQLVEFINFHKKFYAPNNAVLVVAGDFETEATKKMIKDYFGDIPSGEKIERVHIVEEPVEAVKVTEYDSNIQIPIKLFIFRTPSSKDKDAYVLDMVSSILTSGKSSRMYKRLVENKKALQVLAFNDSQEDYGTYIMGALPLGETSLDEIAAEMEDEITKLQTELISEKEYQKLQNTFENRFVNSNSGVQNIANTLARNYMLKGNTNLINDEINIFRSITREDIKRVANTYLNKGHRVEMDYLKKESEQH
ncbi:MAG: insulinase family protein [Lutibacter sp.]|uniref:M16 family metallopeptidase n=1 Tax=Lutibacter sp. TaxID=1925666 RepID=UPI0017DAC7EC|nr:pitrilysin family protein [Lutibacter sp.]MBT8318456.1 insulinase family protein [Lutibacter sp.]NNJ59314.1 insulinase family protein [Lutibacter sp.]